MKKAYKKVARNYLVVHVPTGNVIGNSVSMKQALCWKAGRENYQIVLLQKDKEVIPG